MTEEELRGQMKSDAIYGAAVARRLRAMGVRDKPIAPGSPWQNASAERLIGSILRECVDHMVVVFAENRVRLEYLGIADR